MDFHGIYEREFDYVWHCLRRLGVPEKDLEDAVHDAFVAVFKHLGEYDPTRPIKPWLTGIAYRVAANRRRLAHVRHEVDTEFIPDVQDERPAADTVASDRELQAISRAALDCLDPDRRAVFVLHELEGRPIPELAQELDVSVNTLYSRLRLARAQFTQAARRLLRVGSAP